MCEILFLLKQREDYNPVQHSVVGLSTGLFNSANFIINMLNNNGVDAKIEICIDNNCIDKYVTKHKPKFAVVEALWVVPSKFTVLTKLHPAVKWIVRLHSEMPFLAGEGMALDWIGDYSHSTNVIIGVNAPRMLNEIQSYLKIKNQWTDEYTNERIVYLPNYYPQEYVTKEYQVNKEHINIGCFGAVRPLKNHVLQAIASIKFADRIGKKLHFHINGGRVESKGEPVLNNLRALFRHLYDTGHSLVEHDWTPREEFIKLCSKMDIGLQVSFSETFNIVGADIISRGVPLVGSIEIPWMDNKYTARAQYSDEIFNALLLTHECPQHNVEVNQAKLTEYTNHTLVVWLDQFK